MNYISRYDGDRSLYLPKFYQNRKRLLNFHGHGGNGSSYTSLAFNRGAIEMAKRGVFSAAETYGNSWGNQSACDIATALYNEFAPGKKVILSGGSMGGMAALNWARQNLTKVTAIELLIPALNPEDIRANNLQGLQASLEAAYVNNAGWQAARPNFNPIEYAAQLSAIPIFLYYSTDDPTCRPQFVQQFANLHGRTRIFPLGAVGHSVANMPWANAADLLYPYCRGN